MPSLAPVSMPYALKPTDDAEAVQCTLSVSDNAVCGIFDVPTSEVELEDLPCTWHVQGHDYNTLTMSCGHQFNPSAAAFHFLCQDIRCPICRCGVSKPMRIDSIPKVLQPQFKDRIKKMKDRYDEEGELVDILQMIEIDITNIENDFCLVVDISVNANSRVLLQSPVRAIGNQYERTSFIQFRPQQSFQRILNHHLSLWRQNTDTTLTFSLQHPVIFLPIQTIHLNLQQFIAAMSPTHRAVPFRVYGNGNDEHVVATLLVQGSPTATCNIGLFLDRQAMIALCVACIQNRLQQLVQ